MLQKKAHYQIKIRNGAWEYFLCHTAIFFRLSFYQKRKIAPKVFHNFEIFNQKFTLGCSLELSPNLGTKMLL